MTDEARALVLAISERCPVRTGGTCYCNPLCGCVCHAREVERIARAEKAVVRAAVAEHRDVFTPYTRLEHAVKRLLKAREERK